MNIEKHGKTTSKGWERQTTGKEEERLDDQELDGQIIEMQLGNTFIWT